MADPILTIDAVDFYYDDRVILNQVSLELKSGDFLAIIGPNGGGKSTLIKLILGILNPYSGRISVMGKSPQVARQWIGYLPQSMLLDRAFPISVLEVVSMAALSGGRVFQRFSNTQKQLALQMLDRFGVKHLANRGFSELSGGEKQRVLLARALMNCPRLLILDEPTTGVDSKAQTEFYNLLHELNTYLTIIMVSHDLSAVSQHVKSIACVNQHCIYHGNKELSVATLESTYGCDIDLIAHGVPHRVMHHHHA